MTESIYACGCPASCLKFLRPSYCPEHHQPLLPVPVAEPLRYEVGEHGNAWHVYQRLGSTLKYIASFRDQATAEVVRDAFESKQCLPDKP